MLGLGRYPCTPRLEALTLVRAAAQIHKLERRVGAISFEYPAVDRCR